MRIGIDARVLEKRMTGVGRYLINILNGLPKYDRENEYILFSKSKIDIADQYYKKLVIGNSFLPEKIYSSYWLNFILPKYLRKEGIDLFFTPNHLLPLKKLNAIKSVTVVHDVFHKIDGDFHPSSYNLYLNLLLPNSFKKSDLIITVSNNSKKDIIRIFKVPEQKIHVIYENADESFKPMDIEEDSRKSILDKYDLSSNRLILYVGLVENRKNIIGILKIGDILYKRGINFNILIVGRKGFGFDKIYEEIKIRSSYVKYLNYVDDETLKIIYNLATLFIFPSYYEGFGLPPLEAMQTGIPVLASKTSSLIEVVGEGGILHEPDNYEAFAADIERLFSDSNLYQEMKKKALLQANNFSKEKSIRELIQTFKSLS